MLELGLAAALEGELAGHPLGDEVWDTLRRMTDALAAVVDVRLRPPRQGDGDDGHGLLLDGPGYDRWASLLATGAALFGPAPWWPAVPRKRRPDTAVDRGSPAGRSRPGPGRRVGRRCSRTPAWQFCATPTAGQTSCGAGPTTARTGTCRSPPTPTPTPSPSRSGWAGSTCSPTRAPTATAAEPAWRAWFRSTLAHNTLEVGGVDQSVAAGPHLWTRQARARARAARPGWTAARWPSGGPPTTATGASAHRPSTAAASGWTGGRAGWSSRTASTPLAATTAAWPSTWAPTSPARSSDGRAVLEWPADHGAPERHADPPRRAGLAAPRRPDRPAGRLVLAGVRRARARGHAARERPGRPQARSWSPSYSSTVGARHEDQRLRPRLRRRRLGRLPGRRRPHRRRRRHQPGQGRPAEPGPRAGGRGGPRRAHRGGCARRPPARHHRLRRGGRRHRPRLRLRRHAQQGQRQPRPHATCAGWPATSGRPSGAGGRPSSWWSAARSCRARPARSLLPELERAAGRPVAVAVYPEFLREGTAIRDYREPPKVVVGAVDERSPRPGHRGGERARAHRWSRPIWSWPRWSSTPTTPGTPSR